MKTGTRKKQARCIGLMRPIGHRAFDLGRTFRLIGRGDMAHAIGRGQKDISSQINKHLGIPAFCQAEAIISDAFALTIGFDPQAARNARAKFRCRRGPMKGFCGGKRRVARGDGKKGRAGRVEWTKRCLIGAESATDGRPAQKTI